ncbi:bifunctional phosphoribosyl-AMP cyclohydrolase/phosphoribosyl-ATP diphosphatase HisIE [Gilvibacter sp.]|uniref:bifunctional phosphoribosyl-AMP cyclohydrolase/phosphoribosyl-ATP diphosphatase HisIE n=1 Tax=Gilvibacter sp. TaxID=2729997 RepID=UPI0025C0E39D|nr:bifunctional phosphoribosyl-AMP cyclohydrolase/phosphoribosyl-ATP diphosphatase HisIE [Gilvibacter sp.]NQX76124.1 bifunctional phosphoribosyl-AMP cyclohydrolase/phosphoribosyl-ATP diphosphatase HisIE [Gilvibacter sp.]
MTPNFNKSADGLLPAVIQDYNTRQVLMVGYMNAEAFEKTLAEKRITFYSRSKERLWTKGESSQNYLELKEHFIDCDQDALLFLCEPAGPTCHTGTQSCFANDSALGFLRQLEATIDKKIASDEAESYTRALVQRGINKVAQKVGEEAVELVIEAKDNNDDLFKNEAADLLYHLLILLNVKGHSLADIEDILKQRSKK